MARGAQSLGRIRAPGLALALAIAGFLGAAVWAVAAKAAGRPGHLSAADWSALRFTILQAALSAALSVGLAIPVARALARRRFAGRGVLITLLGAPFILPVIVAVLGLIAVFGRSGLLNELLALAHLPQVSIYGLAGVVLGHLFLNLPLGIRLILQGWQAIPSERVRLAVELEGSRWRLLEWPMLQSVLPGALLAVFLICLTSFTVALTLGGGPKATTLELAIYQAVRFDFDLAKAAQLALLQLALGAAFAAVAYRSGAALGMGSGLDRRGISVAPTGRLPALADSLWIMLAAAFLLLPLAMVVADGIGGLADLPSGIGMAALRSVAVALAAAALSVALALALALGGGPLATLAGSLPLATSALVVGTGVFLMLHGLTNPTRAALPVTAALNALVGLPFVFRGISSAVEEIEANYGRLAASLGLFGQARLRLLILPRLRRPLGFAAGLAAAMSVGDLGVILLFSGGDQETLPLMMYRLMGAYRMDAAAGVALVLVMVSLALFWLFDRGGRTNADA
jgi:thiamine transport system permease protein